MIADRVLHTSTTTGTGTYDLIDPPTGEFLSAVASVGSGNRLAYLAQMDGVWEIGWGVVTAGSPATLTRNLIRSSTGALVNWSAGTKTVSSVLPADLARFGGRGLIPTSAGTANAQTITHATPLRALLAGMEVAFRPGATNTGAMTLNVDGTGVIAVRTPAGNACIGGELLGGVLTSVVYDGTNWVLSATTTGAALINAVSAADARVTLGATATGAGLFTAATAADARTTLGATVIGSALITAASTTDARSAIVAAANPTTSPGAPGSMQALNSGSGSSLEAPAGGVWVCWWLGYSTTTYTLVSIFEVAEVAGGTQLKAGSSNVAYIGVAFRKA
jgi:hypothetical protein